MKSWKKRFNEEFDHIAPPLREDVKNAPIVTATDTKIPVVKTKPPLFKRYLGAGSALAAVAIAIVFAFIGIFKAPAPPPPAFDHFVFTLEINPAVAFVTDADGTVQRITSLNEDADILLSDPALTEKVKNKPLTEAIVAYTDEAAKLGYLDLSAAQSAVRLSSSTETDGNLLSAVSGSLKEYFMTNGIYAVVVENRADVKELCGRLGVAETSDLKELTDALCRLSDRFGERVEEDADAEELQSLYRTYIMGLQTFETVRDKLLKNLNDILLNAQMLQQIARCNYEIMMHKDNPSLLPLDYWRVKKYQGESESEEFTALMRKMEDLLRTYEEKFGVTINDTDELTSAVNVYSFLSGLDLETVFSSLSLSDFQSSAEKYIGILKNIGCDVGGLETLLRVPTTVQEYIAQLETMWTARFRSRAEAYRSIYEQPRRAITEADYGAFVNEITEKYGSLENFWNKK